MTLRYDEWGKPVGLDWSAIGGAPNPVPPPAPKPKKKAAAKKAEPKPERRADECIRGHSFAEHGRQKKSGGGRYCRKCNTERAARFRAEGKQKEYRARTGRVKQPKVEA